MNSSESPKVKRKGRGLLAGIELSVEKGIKRKEKRRLREQQFRALQEEILREEFTKMEDPKDSLEFLNSVRERRVSTGSSTTPEGSRSPRSWKARGKTFP